MGIYVYTRRMEVREIDGIKVGVFKFAHKAWLGYDAPKNFARAVEAQFAAAERAAKANPEVEYFVCDKFDPKARNQVFKIVGEAVVYDSAFDKKPIAEIAKYEGAWRFLSGGETSSKLPPLN